MLRQGDASRLSVWRVQGIHEHELAVANSHVREARSARREPELASHDDTRERMLHAAGPIFAEKGYEGATVREICVRAGANVSAVNYHFGNKLRLYVECVCHAAPSVAAGLPLPLWPSDTPPVTKLRDFIHGVLSLATEDLQTSWQAKLLLRELLRPTDRCKNIASDLLRPPWELLVGILSELLPPGVPGETKHLVAFSVLGQCFLGYSASPFRNLLAGREESGGLDAGRLAAHVARFTLAALGLERPFREGPTPA